MKLFQRLLVAPAALGLLTPISANATEFNLKDISNYSDVDTIEFANSFNEEEESTETNLIAGGEGLVNYGDDFSETTTATFSADFAIGAVDGNTSEDALSALYGYQIDLNTSFTGDDSFDVSIAAGNGGNTLTELDLNDTGTDDVLAIDGISYTFPLGDKVTVLIGNDVPGSSLYNTACVYGGITNTLDDCGNTKTAMDVDPTSTAGSTALSASYDNGDGFTVAFGYEGAGENTAGLLTKEGSDTYGLQFAYEADQYGASVSYANHNTSSADTAYWGLNGYWTPEDVGAVPSISVGYEIGNPEDDQDTTHWFIGFQWDEVGDGTVGAAFGSTQHTADYNTKYQMYEAFYSYPINDSMTVTPLLYIKEASGDDHTGVMVKTSFSF